MSHAQLAGAIAALALLGCGGEARPPDPSTHEPSVAPAPTGPPQTPSDPAGSDRLPGEVRTRVEAPRVIRIRLDDLPAPFATESASRSPEVVAPPSDATLTVPEGFRVQLFADGLPNARWLRETPDHRVLLARSRDNTIVVLEDANGDGVAERRAPFAGRENHLDLPFGMSFSEGHFYVGNQSEVRRYPWRAGQARLEGEGERVTSLPGGGYHQHWTRNVVVAPDGEHLYVTVGSRSNDGVESPPRASVLVMRLDGSERRTFASGLRNPVGLDFHPRTGAPYVTVNERDDLGDGLVPDFFTRLEDGAFYGWPYTYLSPTLVDPDHMRGGRSVRPDLAARTRTPDVLFEAHSAALGLAFAPRSEGPHAFPPRYRNGAFVAHRGSWNRSRGTGYQIVFIPFGEDDRPLGAYEPFVTGFLIDPSGPTTWGRPVGVLARSDGSLLFTDETGGRVYRVSYRGAP